MYEKVSLKVMFSILSYLFPGLLFLGGFGTVLALHTRGMRVEAVVAESALAVKVELADLLVLIC